MKCKLHSARVDTPSMPTYRDYRVCIKEEEAQCQVEATTTTADPLLNWEAGTTFVDIEDDTGPLQCEVTFFYALDQGVVLKDIKENGCTGER